MEWEHRVCEELSTSTNKYSAVKWDQAYKAELGQQQEGGEHDAHTYARGGAWPWQDRKCA
jgi:hypothetical protein